MSQSETCFQEAQRYIPGGVNSPVRAFKAVGGAPLFIKKADGPYVWDEDDKQYIDYVCSWGPIILGHNHPAIREAVTEAVAKGLSYGAPTRIEIELAKKICEIMPNIESVRMVNSGTEATMSAIRLARGVTGRNKIIKFAGGYHGHSDALLVNAGSGALTFGTPSSPGVPEDFVKHTLVADYNNLASVKACFEQYPDEIATIIIEPVAGNMNCVPATREFLNGLRELCDTHGALLIFDEVMCGFRSALGGAQEYYNIKPDITTLGKVIGGGMPVGAYGASQKIMSHLSPEGPVYQAGTLSGNPIAMTAGLVNLTEIAKPGFHEMLEVRAKQLVEGMQTLANKHDIPLCTNQVGSMFGFFFNDKFDKITTFEQVLTSDVERFKRFFHGMLKEGVALAPSAFEVGFISAAHTEAVIDKTLQAVDKVFSTLK